MIVSRIKRLLKRRYKKAVLNVAKEVGKDLYVNGLSYVNSNTYLGNNVNFNGLRILGRGTVRIGDNFHSGMECVFITDAHNYKGKAIPYDSSYIVKDIFIEDNVWLGHGVIVLGGVKIGEGAIVQAGAVVVRDIPPLAIAGGNPAVVFKSRDEKHYYSLKEAKLFN